MKKYLVGVNLGLGDVTGYIVEIANDYIPEKDNMAKLKRKLVRKYHPHRSHLYVDGTYRYNNSTVHCTEDTQEISAARLDVVSISRLDL